MINFFFFNNNNYEFSYFVYSYYQYFVVLFIVFFISSLFFFLCFFLAEHNLYFEKLTGYECGFDPFSDARDPFDIKFYIVCILFILFDIELLYFYPWVLSFFFFNLVGYYVMLFFYYSFILLYFYEWKKNIF